MEIRRAVTEDAPVLALLNRHVQDPHVAAEPLIYRPARVDDVAAWFLARLKDGDTAFIAHEGGESIGYVIFRVIDRPGHLFAHARRLLLVDQLAVVSSARRRGAGRALMNAVEDQARRSGVDAVELDVRSANLGAIAFYAALQYQTEQLHLSRPLRG
jgi:ribosomal protein S18 acetylase RimI-like enzyme